MFSSVSSNKLNWLRLKGVYNPPSFCEKKTLIVSFITKPQKTELYRVLFLYHLFIIAFTHLAFDTFGTYYLCE